MMMSAPHRFRRDRGISMVAVVILVLVTIALLFTGVVMNGKKGDLEVQAKILKGQKDVENARQGRILAEMKDSLANTGLVSAEDAAGGNLDIAKVDDELKRRRTAILTSDESDMGKRMRTAMEESGLFSTLQDLVIAQAAKLAALQTAYEHAKLDADIARLHLESRTALKDQILQPKEAAKTRLAADIKIVKEQIDADKTEFDRRNAEITAKLAAAESDLTAERETFTQWEIKENNKIKDLRRQLNERKVKEVIKHDPRTAHGRIIRPDAERRTAFINIGSRDRVVPGLRFKVARFGKEGNLEFKADIEVKKVWLDTAQVAIVKNYESLLPVVDGDLIVNPFFSTKRPLVVAFAGHVGERQYRLKFSAREAANRMQEIGSDPRMTVGLDADFVLFTETTPPQGERPNRDQWDEYKKAVRLEIPMAEATEYYSYLGD